MANAIRVQIIVSYTRVTRSRTSPEDAGGRRTFEKISCTTAAERMECQFMSFAFRQIEGENLPSELPSQWHDRSALSRFKTNTISIRPLVFETNDAQDLG
jgi:hypothetical protein